MMVVRVIAGQSTNVSVIFPCLAQWFSFPFPPPLPFPALFVFFRSSASLSGPLFPLSYSEWPHKGAPERLNLVCFVLGNDRALAPGLQEKGVKWDVMGLRATARTGILQLQLSKMIHPDSQLHHSFQFLMTHRLIFSSTRIRTRELDAHYCLQNVLVS